LNDQVKCLVTKLMFAYERLEGGRYENSSGDYDGFHYLELS